MRLILVGLAACAATGSPALAATVKGKAFQIANASVAVAGEVVGNMTGYSLEIGGSGIGGAKRPEAAVTLRVTGRAQAGGVLETWRLSGGEARDVEIQLLDQTLKPMGSYRLTQCAIGTLKTAYDAASPGRGEESAEIICSAISSSIK